MRFSSGPFLVNQVPRLLARWGLIAVLLHTSGWLAISGWSASVLVIPGLQILGLLGTLGHPSRSQPFTPGPWSRSLQRLYQLTLQQFPF